MEFLLSGNLKENLNNDLLIHSINKPAFTVLLLLQRNILDMVNKRKNKVHQHLLNSHCKHEPMLYNFQIKYNNSILPLGQYITIFTANSSLCCSQRDHYKIKMCSCNFFLKKFNHFPLPLNTQYLPQPTTFWSSMQPVVRPSI